MQGVPYTQGSLQQHREGKALGAAVSDAAATAAACAAAVVLLLLSPNHRVSDVYVCSIWQLCDCRVQVYDVSSHLLLVHIRVNPLHQSGLA